MTTFTHNRLVLLRSALTQRWPMTDLCAIMYPAFREEVVEAIDALHRHEKIGDALAHLNRVLALQAGGVPLINGREACFTAADRGRSSYSPMF